MTQDNNENDRRFKITVDGQHFEIKDPILTGRQILAMVNKVPIEEHLLYLLGPANQLEDIDLEEAVDLRGLGKEVFITFRSDRSYRFELDGSRQDWGAPKVTETKLRDLAGIADKPQFFIWQERRDEKDMRLEPGQWVDLTSEGVERFYKHESIAITVVNEDNGDEFKIYGEKSTPMTVLIKLIYDRLKVERKPDDRLRCESSKADVFASEKMTLGEYMDTGVCRCLVLLFASGTGGALCRQR
jgi:hypothetical protein